MVIFGQREGRTWENKVFRWRRQSAGGAVVDVWNM